MSVPRCEEKGCESPATIEEHGLPGGSPRRLCTSHHEYRMLWGYTAHLEAMIETVQRWRGLAETSDWEPAEIYADSVASHEKLRGAYPDLPIGDAPTEEPEVEMYRLNLRAIEDALGDLLSREEGRRAYLENRLSEES